MRWPPEPGVRHDQVVWVLDGLVDDDGDLAVGLLDVVDFVYEVAFAANQNYVRGATGRQRRFQCEGRFVPARRLFGSWSRRRWRWCLG